MTDTILLKKYIKDSGLKMSYLAKQISRSYQTLSNKVNNRSEFTYSEAKVLSECLHINQSEREKIFFAKNVD